MWFETYDGKLINFDNVNYIEVRDFEGKYWVSLSMNNKSSVTFVQGTRSDCEKGMTLLKKGVIPDE